MASLKEASPSLGPRQDTALDKTLRKLRAARYPEYAVYLFVSFIFVFTLANVVSVLYARICLRPTGHRAIAEREVGDETRSLRRGGRVALRRLPHSVANAVRIIACRTTIPFAPGVKFTLIEAFICTCHLLALLIFEFVNIRNVAGVLDPQYWANRAAVLAVSQLALIVALSGKSNIISLLTGISYEKLNIFHRAFSRSILILIWVHMFGRWKLGFTGNDSLYFGWLRSGIVANTCLTLLVFLGTRQLRDVAYEFFLSCHIVLSIIFLVAAGIHVTNARQFLPYVWSACIFWALDRVLRLVRTLRIRYLYQHASGSSPANVVALSADTVGVSLRIHRSSCKLVRFGWRPGQSAYLSVPSVARWGLGLSTEAHPFTIASITGASADTKDRGTDSVDREDTELEIKFIIRVRSGFTRRLHEHAIRAGGACTVSAYIDGPYGNPPTVYSYQNVVLVAGGSGVSFTLPLLLDLVRRARKGPPSTICSRVKFVWYVRERAHFETLAQELHALQDSLLASIKAEINVFVTGMSDLQAELGSPSLHSTLEKSTEAVTPGEASSSEKLGPEALELECNKENVGASSSASRIPALKYGKPLVAEILSEEIGICADSVAVCVSGPQSLIDDVRGALRKPDIAGPVAVLRGGPSVFLHVEHFGM